MITPSDLINSKRRSGYSYVQKDNQACPKPYQCYSYLPRGGPTRPRVMGPRRATALEAAQDYCDLVNGNGQAPAPKLNNPSHPRRAKIPMSRSERQHYKAYLAARDRRRARQPKKAGRVYCIGMKGNGAAVKIGHSNDTRLADLQTGNPWELKLLGTIPGTVEDERRLHAKYIKQNMVGEWFRPTPELLSEFDLNEGSPLD